MTDIKLCVCSHAHFSGDHCWCGCTCFTPDEGDDYPLGKVVG